MLEWGVSGFVMGNGAGCYAQPLSVHVGSDVSCITGNRPGLSKFYFCSSL